MRTTVTLDPDSEQIIRRKMRETGASFKEAINVIIRASVSDAAARKPFRTRVVSMGEPKVDLDKALQLAADIEDEELLGRMDRGS